VQSSNKCYKGRFIEKLGLWMPYRRKTVDRAIIFNKHRLHYWLSVGAKPTEGVHRLLSMVNILPKKPIPFGSKSVYPKPEKTYNLEFFHKHRWGLEPDKVESNNEFYLQKIQEMKQIYDRKNMIDNEALNELV
jgi:ribosomal protein S16